MFLICLNSIRAGIYSSLQLTDFTSIKQRIKQVKSYQRRATVKATGYTVQQQPKDLVPFAGDKQQFRRCAHRHGQSWYKGVG